MRFSIVRVILRKELMDLLRDRRTLFMMVVVPILLYPLLLIVAMQMAIFQAGRLQEKPSQVVIIGETFAPRVIADYDTSSLLQRADSLDWRTAISEGELDAAIEFGKGFEDSIAVGGAAEVAIFYNSSREFSRRTRARLEAPLEQYREETIHSRMVALDADPGILEPFVVADQDLASEEQQQGAVIGGMLGYLLIFMVVTGAFYSAIDLTAGEKERGTLETLLVTPVSRPEIVYGKFFATVTAAILTAMLNIISMGLTAVYGLQLVGQTAEGLSQIAINPLSFLLVLLIVIPLAVLFSGVCLAIAVTARNFKEGQSALTPVLIVAILPAMAAMLPGVEMSPAMALIPITNVVLLTVEFMQGNYPFWETLITMATTSLFAVLSLRWVTYQFRQESVLFRHAEEIRWSLFRRSPRPPREPYPSPSAALLMGTILLIVLNLIGSFAMEWGAIRSIVVVEAIILLPVVLVVYRGRYDARTVIGLRAPRPAVWPATLLIAVSGWLVTVELAAFQHSLIPFPEDLLEQFQDLFDTLNQLPMLSALVVIAVLPALCEETLCRGFMLRSFMSRISPASAIIMVAIIFGLLHMNPYRLLPTVMLGILLGILAYRTGSIYPAMLGHFMTNALSFLVERNSEWLEQLEWLGDSESEMLPVSVVVIAVIALGGGLVWLWRIEVPDETGNAKLET